MAPSYEQNTAKIGEIRGTVNLGFKRPVHEGYIGVRPAQPLGGPGRPPPASPSSPSLQPAETLGNIKCYGVHYVGTLARTAATFRTSGNTILLPGTLSGYTCSLGNTICYRVHYPGTRVPGRQQRLASGNTGYIIRVHVYPDERWGTLFVIGYIIRVHVYPDDSDV